MSAEHQDPIGSYTVLVNAEEQHSLWPSHKEIPAGWRSVGIHGSKADCLEYVERNWTDITPLSVRKRMAGTQS